MALMVTYPIPFRIVGWVNSLCAIRLFPALLYYPSIFREVRFRVKRDSMVGMHPPEIPSVWSALRRGWPHLASLAVPVAVLSMGFRAIYAAVLACITVVEARP